MNFEYWNTLYKRDPKKFEEERKNYLSKIINESSNKNKLMKLQWKIDMERKRCKTPLKSLIKIQDMMWESFFKLNDVLQQFRKEN